MPLGSPDLLDTFQLGKYQLKANAPDTLRGGLKASFKFFFYKDGPTKVQKGRTIPKPITLGFKYSGAGAFDAAMTLQAMADEQALVTLSWAKAFNYEGYLTEFDFDVSQKLLTGTLTYQPTKDLLRGNANAASLQADFKRSVPVLDMEDVGDLLGGLLGFLAGALEMVQGLIQFVDDGLAGMFEFLDSARNAVDFVNNMINTFGDFLNTPFLVLDEAWSIIHDALDLLPTAMDLLRTKFFEPAIPLFDGIEKDLGIAEAQTLASTLDDTETQLNILANAVKPPTGEYLVQDGDSLDIIADLFDTSVDALLSLNAGLTPATLAPGQTMKVPVDGSTH